MNEEIIQEIARKLKVSLEQVKNTLGLLEEGNTVPFIARYRKEATRGLDEEQILYIETQYQYEVNLAERKEAVLKLIEEQGKLTDEIRNEIGVMQKFVGYSNIVSYEDYLINKHENDIGWDILIRMELLTTLSDYMTRNPINEQLVLKIGMDISQALIILHGSGIIHRDIKPQNIFINDRGFFKLGDFGISKAITQTGGVMSFKGSVAYMAPETFAMRGTDARSDIYSLGLVLYRCLNGGREPLLKSSSFTPAQKEEAQHLRLIGTRLPAPAYASRPVAAIFAKALDPDPAARFQTAEQFYQALAGVAERKKGGGPSIPQQPLHQASGWPGAQGSGTNAGGTSGNGYGPAVNRGGTGGSGYGPAVNRGGTGGSGYGPAVNRGDTGGKGYGPAVNRGDRIRNGTGKNLPGTKRNGAIRIALLITAAAAIVLLIGASVWMILGNGDSSGKSSDSNMASASDMKNSMTDGRESVTRTGTIQYDGDDAGNAVEFADPALEAAIQKEIGLEDRPITVADAVNDFEMDLSGDTKEESGKIRDLTGLSFFENLQELTLSGNLITDIEELGDLSGLEYLDLGENRITDLAPLQGLHSLNYLDLVDNEIENIAPVTGLTSLHMLDVSGNLLTSLEGIQNLTGLEMLLVGRNDLSDIRPVGGLKELYGFEACENNIEKIDALEKLTNMYILSLYGNQIEDLSPLKKMDGLHYLMLDDNQIHDISPILELESLEEVSLSGNPIEDSGSINRFPDSVSVYAD